MKARSPLLSWRVVSRSGPEVTPVERDDRSDQGDCGEGGKTPAWPTCRPLRSGRLFP